MPGDYIDILDAAYRMDGDEDAWLGDIGRAVACAVPGASDAWAMLYDVSRPGFARVKRLAFTGEAAGVAAGMVARLLVGDGSDGRFGHASCALASEASDGDVASDVLETSRARGVSDVLGLNGADPSGAGVFIAVNLGRERPAELSAAMRELGSRIAAHAAAAYRLRRRLNGDGLDGADAVMRDDGAVVHAEGDASSRAAQKVLRDAIVSLDRARGRLRRAAPSKAVAGWKALVAARWSLVDHFAKDGTRYVVARRNEPEAPSLESLSDRERQVVAFALLGHANKLIAYELGIATSTVGVLLSRAMAKLGYASRKELIAALGRRRQ